MRGRPQRRRGRRGDDRRRGHRHRLIIVADARLRRPVQRAGHLDGERAAARRASRCATSTWSTAATSCSTNLSFKIAPGEIFVIMGGSGCGKSTLLRHMIGLVQPARGEVFYDGDGYWGADPDTQAAMLRRFGVLFQGGALWSSMTLAENIALPLQQYTKLSAPRDPRGRGAQAGAGRPCTASRTTTRRRSAAACASAPASPAPWRSIPRSCSSTSRRPASTRSARSGSTT